MILLPEENLNIESINKEWLQTELFGNKAIWRDSKVENKLLKSKIALITGASQGIGRGILIAVSNISNLFIIFKNIEYTPSMSHDMDFVYVFMIVRFGR